MTYTISEIAERMGVSVHTLRFYDLEPDTIPEDAHEYAQHYLEANKEENV